MKYKTILLKYNNFINPSIFNNVIELQLESSLIIDDFEDILDSIGKECDDDDLIVILDEKSSSIINKKQIDKLMETLAILLTDNIDIIYLSNFLDNCQSNIIINTKIDPSISHIKFYKSLAPNGLYCVVSTFFKWKNIISKLSNLNNHTFSSQLSTAVTSKKINAVTTWPRIIIPNIDIISDNIENYYTYPCRFEKVYGRTVPNTEQMSFYWFCLGSIIVIVCTWIIAKVSPKNKYIFYSKLK